MWPGAQIAELPDLSEILLTAKVDEEDRGRLRTGQTATVRVDAAPGRELHATVDDISVLARVDFSAGWPAVRNFDLRLRLDAGGAELRPGMSATARLEVDRLDDVLIMPARAVFNAGGRPVAYRLVGSRFEPAPRSTSRNGRGTRWRWRRVSRRETAWRPSSPPCPDCRTVTIPYAAAVGRYRGRPRDVGHGRGRPLAVSR